MWNIFVNTIKVKSEIKGDNDVRNICTEKYTNQRKERKIGEYGESKVDNHTVINLQ